MALTAAALILAAVLGTGSAGLLAQAGPPAAPGEARGDGEAPRLTLAGSLEQALEHSPRIALARSRSRQSQAQVDQAESLLRPRLDATGTVAESKTPSQLRLPIPVETSGAITYLPPIYDHESMTTGSVGLTYSQVLLERGETRLQLEQARLAPAAAAAQEAADRIALLKDVESAYLGVLEARSGVNLARLLERNARAMAETVREQHQAGVASELDVLAAETAAARATQGRRAAEDGLEMAWEALYQVMGTPRPEAWPALEPVAYPPVEALLLDLDLERLKEQARSGRPEMIQARFHLEQARLALEQARLQGRPSLALQGSYQTEDGEETVTVAVTDQAAVQASVTHSEADVRYPEPEESWQVGLQVTWPILDGGARAAAIRQAEEAVTQAELTLQQLEAGIALELARQHSELTQAMLDLASAEKAAAEAAGRLRRVQVQAESGAATRLQVWDAEAAVAQADHQRRQALHSLLRARTALAAAAGFPPEQILHWIILQGGE